MIATGDVIRVRKGRYLFAERFRRGPVRREMPANLFAFDTAAGTWQDMSASLAGGVVTELGTSCR